MYAVLICDNVPNAVVLTHSGPHSIEVVKVLRRWTGLALWDSRLLLDRLPATILEDVTQETAEAAVRELLEAGAEAEVRPQAPARSGWTGSCSRAAGRSTYRAEGRPPSSEGPLDYSCSIHRLRRSDHDMASVTVPAGGLARHRHRRLPLRGPARRAVVGPAAQ
ncbi:ribosomal protein L7/L12 [Kitasatospora griseola]|uniref:ribosomal protein L7/L12 n=1 Tax=Kitasatospora griseola TaxID=2064 RepID=UPI003449AB13